MKIKYNRKKIIIDIKYFFMESFSSENKSVPEDIKLKCDGIFFEKYNIFILIII